ncbi:MAG: copper amine oxidase N-terminal domain-containing protein [Ruminococcaceae bacterium]|nr:copper amine oxidase N-terminal domain-containing protein [Oscillospiraceae bacterium]
MKKRLQGFVAGFLFLALLTSVGTFAKQITERAELFYDNIKIYIDGNEIVPKDATGNIVEPFIMNGTTYLPVRAVGTAFGKNVQWDAATKSAYIGNAEIKPSGAFSANEVLNNLTVTAYTWKNSYYHYLALVVKNNSDIHCRLSANVQFKDANGNLVGVQEEEIMAFEAKQEACLVFANDIEFADFSYDFNVSQLKYYDCVTSAIAVDVITLPEKAIISATNNGSVAAEFLEYNILYLKNGKVVDRDWGFLTDDDSELKPGHKETEESRVYEDYDEAKVFLSGRATK